MKPRECIFPGLKEIWVFSALMGFAFDTAEDTVRKPLQAKAALPVPVLLAAAAAVAAPLLGKVAQTPVMGFLGIT